MNGAAENGRNQDINNLIGVMERKITLNMENGSNRKEHERIIHTVGHHLTADAVQVFDKSRDTLRI